MAQFEKFINKRFSETYLSMLAKIMTVVNEYTRQGFDLSLRQLYYQLVAHDLFPDTWVDKVTGSKNCVANYKRLVGLVGDGREAGIIPWDVIVDRNRSNMNVSTWTDPAGIMESAVRSYREDLWIDQPWHLHVMVEKDALSGVLWPVCSRFGVEFTANKGYSSLSMLYWTAKKFEQIIESGRSVRVLYLGDHDPSGIDMTRDIEERLRTFSNTHWKNSDMLEVKRIALNYDQVIQYDPPENPAKETDSRFQEYYDQFGDTCWELDALEPIVLRDLVEREVNEVIDTSRWDKAKQSQETNRSKLEVLTQLVSKHGIDEVIHLAEMVDADEDLEDDEDFNDDDE